MCVLLVQNQSISEHTQSREREQGLEFRSEDRVEWTANNSYRCYGTDSYAKMEMETGMMYQQHRTNGEEEVTNDNACYYQLLTKLSLQRESIETRKRMLYQMTVSQNFPTVLLTCSQINESTEFRWL